MTYIRFLTLLSAIILCLSLPGCRTEPDPRDILAEMCETQANMPAGQIYYTSAAAGTAEYANEELIAALYGNGTTPPEWASIRDFAIRLAAFAEPCEFAVFRCTSTQDAEDVARMCLRRVQMLRRACRDTDYEKLTADATVSVRGCYVLMAVCHDAPSAIAAGRRLCR